jgi:hypothetical protein
MIPLNSALLLLILNYPAGCSLFCAGHLPDAGRFFDATVGSVCRSVAFLAVNEAINELSSPTVFLVHYPCTLQRAPVDPAENHSLTLWLPPLTLSRTSVSHLPS